MDNATNLIIGIIATLLAPAILFSLHKIRNLILPKRISWKEYWQQIKMVENCLEIIIREENVNFACIFGISNGGLIVADIIGQMEIFGGKTPVKSIWINRGNVTPSIESEEKVHNKAEIKAMIDNLKLYKNDNACTILVIDDAIDSGSTFRKTKEIITEAFNENLGSATKLKIVFIPLFAKRKDVLEGIKDDLAINLLKNGKKSFDMHCSELLTQKYVFPYGKCFRFQ